MRILKILVILCVLLCFGCEQMESEVKKEETISEARGTIVAMGDSLTAGLGVNRQDSYPAMLEKKLHELGYHYRVVNSGVSGETSSGARSRLSWVLKLDPDIVILETGANDGLRGISPTLIEENIRTIIQLLQEKNIIVVLAGMQMVGNMGEEYTDQFKLLYSELARKYNVIFAPFFLENVAARQELNQADGIHPTAEGYQKVTENILPYVVEAVKEYEQKNE
jgi:acyl-CoA thioesterase I